MSLGAAVLGAAFVLIDNLFFRPAAAEYFGFDFGLFNKGCTGKGSVLVSNQLDFVDVELGADLRLLMGYFQSCALFSRVLKSGYLKYGIHYDVSSRLYNFFRFKLSLKY